MFLLMIFYCVCWLMLFKFVAWLRLFAVTFVACLVFCLVRVLDVDLFDCVWLLVMVFWGC